MRTGLLAQHIRRHDQAVHVIIIPRLDRKDVAMAGGWQIYLQHYLGWKQSTKPVFIMDEGQALYDDTGLWFGLFKDIEKYPKRFASAFASYGSPISRFNVRNIPFLVGDNQRVSLHHKDQDVHHSLYGIM